MKSQLKYSIFCFVLATMILTTSCKHKEVLSIDNNITFDTIRVTTNYHIDNDSTKPSCNLKLTFIYPKACENAAILDSIQHIFNAAFLDETYGYYSPQEAIKMYSKSYIENYKSDFDVFYTEKISIDESDKYFSYYETITNKILFNKDNILSFQVTQTNYKGGADSYEFVKNFVIDLNTGLQITESDLFNNGFENSLTPIFKEYILRNNQVKTLNELDNLGYFGVDEIIPNGNILIDDKGITYTFNKGEYSAYKLDPIMITIPYPEVAFLMKDDSPIGKFIDK